MTGSNKSILLLLLLQSFIHVSFSLLHVRTTLTYTFMYLLGHFSQFHCPCNYLYLYLPCCVTPHIHLNIIPHTTYSLVLTSLLISRPATPLPVLGYTVMHNCHLSSSSSIVYHRLIYSTQSVGAMLWSMAQLRRGQLRMVVDVVGSC